MKVILIHQAFVSHNVVQILVEAIAKLVSDRDLLIELAERGHCFAGQRFFVEPAVKKLSTIINEAINNR